MRGVTLRDTERLYRVLGIEDDPDDATLLAMTLRRAAGVRFHVDTASTLNAAFDLLGSGSYDVIALDLSLPDASGAETFQRLRVRAKDLPIVVMTGLDDDELALRLIHEGAQDYVVKSRMLTHNTVRCFEYAVERNRVERELVAAREAAEEAARVKSTFVAAMSHEIRTPLHAILGMADILLESPLNEDQREYVLVFRRAGRILLELLNNALELSRLESGRFEFECRAFELRPWLDDILELFAFTAHRKGLELAADVEPAVPDTLVGDPSRLRQVLINLVGNAVKFTERGGVLVRTHCEGRTEASAALCIEVFDTGPGIPEDRLSTIFDRFAQGGACVAGDYGGSGLGLALCRELLERMGGRIEAANRREDGSVFSARLELPCKPAPRERADPDAPLAGKRVLLVEEGDLERAVVSRALQDAGAEVVEGRSAADARRALAGELTSATFDGVVLDGRMRDGGGLDVAESVRRNREGGEKRLVILLPMDHRVGDLARCERAGAVSLIKPVRVEALVGVLACRPGARLRQESTREAPHSEPARRLRLLVAEDSADNLALLRAYLRGTDWIVRVAGNGRRAVELRSSEPFDAALMDVGMPELDGYEATRQIRKWERRTGAEPLPIIALTAHAGDERRARDAGCNAYLAKPVDRETLLQAVAARAREARLRVAVEPEIADLVPEFLENCAGDVARLRRALEAGDFETIRTLGHRMKGSGSGYGFPHISHAGAELERAAQARDAPRVERGVDNLESCLLRTEASTATASAGSRPPPAGAEPPHDPHV